jgi:deoxyhypusine synthase
MPFPYDLFDVTDIRTYPLASRPSKARAEDFGRPVGRGGGVHELLESLPKILAASDLKAVVAAIVRARRSGRGILWGLGAHVVKTGLGPILIDLMERGFVSAVATNGAAVIHDFELALSGATSEDVDQALGPGRFGMAEET